MATVICTLSKGLAIGDQTHTEAELREATSGDVIEAMEEAERLVMLPGKDEPALVVSPTMVGVNLLRRQIVRIGNYAGPLSLLELKRLHPDDLNRLQNKAEELEAAGLSGLTDRGRDDRG